MSFLKENPLPIPYISALSLIYKDSLRGFPYIKGDFLEGIFKKEKSLEG